MYQLPNELILDILNRSSETELFRFCQSNSRYRTLCHDRSLWINQIPLIYFKPKFITWYQFYHQMFDTDLNRIVLAQIYSNRTYQFIFLPSGLYYLIVKPTDHVLRIGNLFEEKITVSNKSPYYRDIEKIEFSLYSPQLKNLIINYITNYCAQQNYYSFDETRYCDVEDIPIESAYSILSNAKNPNDTLEGQNELNDILNNPNLIVATPADFDEY